MRGEQRKVVLRAERDEVDSRFLEAYLDELGNLHFRFSAPSGETFAERTPAGGR
jgi:hypothetical protein